MTVYKVLGCKEVKQFIERCVVAAGASHGHAEALSNVLVSADRRGHFSHGLNRLELYVNDLKSGLTVCSKEPSIEKEALATALVNGNDLLGPVVGKFCIDLAIKKAKECGMGMVSCHSSNHFGIAGWYAIRACDQGLVGFAMTNTSPLMVATNSKEKTLGTNPIACAAPANNNDSFVLDMATTSVALGKVELNRVVEKPIPNGWAVDANGKQTNDPVDVLKRGGGLLPLGGIQEAGGYKGFGLAMMVEVLCGIMSGGNVGPQMRSWLAHDSARANVSHCFIAIDPSGFASGFTDRMSNVMDHCRSLESITEGETVMVAGDPERKHIAKVEKDGGISYHVNVISVMNVMATKLGVEILSAV